jgi:hypothetical protein
MKVLSLNIDKQFNTTFYDPSPHRFREEEKPVSKRTIPVVFTCENCSDSLSFRSEDFEKHNQSTHTNLLPADKNIFDEFIKKRKLKNSSFLDLYCPGCRQATTILFKGGPSGYWGFFEFRISHILVLKPSQNSNANKLLLKLKQLISYR